MTPFHTGFVRELHTTTALQSCLSWRVSENVRAVRDQQGANYLVVKPDFYANTMAAAAVERTRTAIEQARI